MIPAIRSQCSPRKKNSIVKTRSTRITRKIEMTTARVVERPTCSAPPPVSKSFEATHGGDGDAEHDALDQAGDDVAQKQRIERGVM